MSIISLKPRVKAEGQFHCPECNGVQKYTQIEIRLIALWLIPVKTLGGFVGCLGCNNAWDPEILTVDLGKLRQEFESNFVRTVKRLMVIVMMADGNIQDEEIKSIQEVFGKLANRRISEAEIRAEIKAVESKPMEATEYLNEIAPCLNEHSKELMLKAAFLVAAADGEFQDEEKDQIFGYAQALGVSPTHLRGIFDELFSKREVEEEA